ncbi:MAG: hypothetical protein IKQ41_03570 [Clostridia bacterium]|nr:hypothetical protein [Clostridia bacterium]
MEEGAKNDRTGGSIRIDRQAAGRQRAGSDSNHAQNVAEPGKDRGASIRCHAKNESVSGTAGHAEKLKAIEDQSFRDFEDALQDCCAAEAGCGYIITANGKGFLGHSQVTIKSPDEFIALVSANQGSVR